MFRLKVNKKNISERTGCNEHLLKQKASLGIFQHVRTPSKKE